MRDDQLRKLLGGVIEELHHVARHDGDQWLCHNEPCETWREVKSPHLHDQACMYTSPGGVVEIRCTEAR